MTISTITSLAPCGPAWTNKKGKLMYPFSVAFADRTTGQVNSFSAQIPHTIGETVGYEITGDFQGVNKIYITKNPPQTAPQQQAPQNQYQQPPAQPQPYQAPYQPPVQQTPPPPPQQQQAAPTSTHGQTVGMAINNAVDACLRSGLLCHMPDFIPTVYEIASDIIRMSWSLEHAQLAPQRFERNKKKQQPPAQVQFTAPQQQPQVQPVQQQPPAPQPQQQVPQNRPQPGPGGSAFPDNLASEDVPF